MIVYIFDLTNAKLFLQISQSGIAGKVSKLCAFNVNIFSYCIKKKRERKDSKCTATNQYRLDFLDDLLISLVNTAGVM